MTNEMKIICVPERVFEHRGDELTKAFYSKRTFVAYTLDDELILDYLKSISTFGCYRGDNDATIGYYWLKSIPDGEVSMINVTRTDIYNVIVSAVHKLLNNQEAINFLSRNGKNKIVNAIIKTIILESKREKNGK